MAQGGGLLRVQLQALVDFLQATVLWQGQHQVDLRRLGQLVEQDLHQSSLGAVFLVFHRHLAEAADQFAQQVADPEHVASRLRPGGDAAIEVQAAHFRARRAEHPVRHAGGDPHGPLRRRDEAPGAGLHLEHPLNGVGQLHPGMAVAAGQGAIGQ